MKFIVLTITQYKEKDGIIFGISEEGPMTLTARGMLDPKNKNSGLNNPLTIADIELGSDRFKYPVIKSSTVLVSPLKVNNDYFYLGGITLLGEATNKLLQEDEMGMMFKHLAAAIKAIKEVKEPWMILLIYLLNVLKATGYDFQVDECVFCGSRKDIVTFSFLEGGFVCKNCMNENIERPFNHEQMLLLRAAYFAKNYKVTTDHCTKENAIALLSKFKEFINDSFGVNLASIDFLIK